MQLRRKLGVVLLGIALASGGVAAARGGGGGDTGGGGVRPNVVVVMTDDQAQTSAAKMPAVQSELVEQGTTFTNSFTNWPLCCPSRATFYTGQYAHNHGVLGNSAPEGGFVNFNDTSTLPVWLQSAGYRTIHVGKYLNGYGQGSSDPTYLPPGWNEWYAAFGRTTQDVYGYELNQNGALVNYGNAATDFKQDVLTDLAVDAINRNAANGPFFLGVMYTAPHAGGPDPSPRPPSDCPGAKPAPRHASAFDSEPLPRPPNFNEADVSDKPAAIQSQNMMSNAAVADLEGRYRCRLESLLSVDDGVRRIVEALRAGGELDDTLIVFTSDNGFFAGEHRIRTAKDRVYEEAIRVPLVIRGPGVPKAGSVGDLVVNADLAPTILDAAGAQPGLSQDGRSLLPFADHPRRLHGRELAIVKSVVSGVEDAQEEVSGTFQAVRTSRYIYVRNGSGEIELYDLERDPYELQNQHGNPDYAEIEAALVKRLAAVRGCGGPSCKSAPALDLKLPRKQRGRSCRSPRGFVVQVRGGASAKVQAVRFRVGPKGAGHDSGKPLKKRIRRRLLRHGRKPEIRAIAELIDGRQLSLQQRVRVCG